MVFAAVWNKFLRYFRKPVQPIVLPKQQFRRSPALFQPKTFLAPPAGKPEVHSKHAVENQQQGPAPGHESLGGREAGEGNPNIVVIYYYSLHIHPH